MMPTPLCETYFDGETLRDKATRKPVKSVEFKVAYPPEWVSAFRVGVRAAIKIIEERGEQFNGAIQPDRTIAEITERLLNG